MSKIKNASDKQLKELIALKPLIKEAKKELKQREKTSCGICEHGDCFDWCPVCSH